MTDGHLLAGSLSSNEICPILLFLLLLQIELLESDFRLVALQEFLLLVHCLLGI